MYKRKIEDQILTFNSFIIESIRTAKMATEADFRRIGNYARMYNRDQHIDRHKSKRTVPLEAISLGFSRTGTMTMHKAFTILGYPAYHFSSFYDNVSESDMWMEAINAKYYGKGTPPDKAFFDGILGHVGAVTDAPCNLFGKELVEFYPDAKVISVERDIDSWYTSWMSFCQSAYDPTIFVLGRLNPSFLGKIARLGGAITTIQSGHAKNINEVRVRCRASYQHHYRDVKDFTPQHRLLEFKLNDGWEPLCQFLGKPIPVSRSNYCSLIILTSEQSVPFPHENEAASNQQAFKELGQMALKSVFRSVVTVASLVAILVAGCLYNYPYHL